MRRTLLALSIAALLTGCGSDDDNDRPIAGDGGSGGGNPPPAEVIEITGAAMAPGGMVTQWQPYSSFQVVMNFLISPAAAAITGLSPIAGAEVELFRVGNDGERVGDVLATDTTNDDGEYELELPEGEELSGDLVVSISAAGRKLRAQVVAEQVDITPVSEYVLTKLVESGTALATVSKDAVVQLTETIEALDIAAGPDMTAVLAQLDDLAGTIVEESIDIIATPPGDATDIAGSYRNSAFQFGFDTRPGSDAGGEYMIDTWITDIDVSAGESGKAIFALGQEKSSYAEQSRWSIWVEEEVEDLSEEEEPFGLNVGANGTLSLIEPREEEVDDDILEIYPGKVYKFRKVIDRDIYVLDANDTTSYYSYEDSDGDGTAEQGELLGRELFRGIEFMSRMPTNAKVADITGTFGRVYQGTFLLDNGYMEIESEMNTLSFNGAGDVSITGTVQHRLTRNHDGASTYEADEAEAEGPMVYGVSSKGQLSFEDDDGSLLTEDAFINNSFDFLVGNNFASEEDDNPNDSFKAEVDHDVTLAVKLPSSALSIDQRVYRIYQVENEITGGYHGLNALMPDSLLTMTSPTSARLEVSESDVGRGGLTIDKESGEAEASVTLDPNGKVTIVVEDGGATFTMTGFFNETGSLAVLQTIQKDEGAVTALGLAVLLEIED